MPTADEMEQQIPIMPFQDPALEEVVAHEYDKCHTTTRILWMLSFQSFESTLKTFQRSTNSGT
jgi:hypothetical protein